MRDPERPISSALAAALEDLDAVGKLEPVLVDLLTAISAIEGLRLSPIKILGERAERETGQRRARSNDQSEAGRLPDETKRYRALDLYPRLARVLAMCKVARMSKAAPKTRLNLVVMAGAKRELHLLKQRTPEHMQLAETYESEFERRLEPEARAVLRRYRPGATPDRSDAEVAAEVLTEEGFPVLAAELNGLGKLYRKELKSNSGPNQARKSRFDPESKPGRD